MSLLYWSGRGSGLAGACAQSHCAGDGVRGHRKGLETWRDRGLRNRNRWPLEGTGDSKERVQLKSKEKAETKDQPTVE